MKKWIFVVAIMTIVFCLKTTISANSSIFIWEKTEINIEFGGSLEDALDEIKQGVKLKQGYNDPDFYVDNDGINYTFKHVINTKVLKSYHLYHQAVSLKYNQKETRLITIHIIDVNPPEIIFSNPIYLNLEDKKPDYHLFISYKDDTTQTDLIHIEINDNAVNLKEIGKYEVFYTLTDLSGNQITHVEYVYVEDHVKPIIKRKDNVYIIGTHFNIYDYFEAEDNYDDFVKIEFQLKDSIVKEGKAEVELTAKDSSGNTTKITSYIECVLDKPPVVTSSNPFTIAFGNKKPDYLNYIRYEDDFTPTKDIMIVVNDQYVNYDILGEYEIIYQLTDSRGNETLYVERVFIVDMLKPVITKIENNTYQIGSEFDIYDYFGVKDNYDYIIDLNYEIEGDLNSLGRIDVNLWAIDSSGNRAELKSFIEIVNINPPKLTLTIESVEINVFEDIDNYLDYIEIGNHIGILTKEDIIIVNEVDYGKIGSYEIVFSLTDMSGLTTTQTLIVYIQDKIPPIIYAENKTIQLYENIDLLEDVFVSDNYSNLENIRLTIYNTNLNTNIKGNYFITYEAIDESGNHSYQTVTITVISKQEETQLNIYILIGVGTVLIGVGVAIFIILRRKKRLF